MSVQKRGGGGARKKRKAEKPKLKIYVDQSEWSPW